MADVFNWSFFQIPQAGVTGSTMGIGAQTRDLNMKMSNFGAMNVSTRMSDDYTRTVLDFQTKDELLNPTVPFQDADMNDNPLLEGSSLKYTRDDQFIRMTMTTSLGTSIGNPVADVMDTDAISAVGMESPRNLCWVCLVGFGGKHDFPVPYDGK